jgi:hypothetical protein
MAVIQAEERTLTHDLRNSPRELTLLHDIDIDIDIDVELKTFAKGEGPLKGPV